MQDIIAGHFQAEAGRVVALLYAHIRDFDLVEDVVQDAYVKALEVWPGQGVPRNPGGWIYTTARRKAIDRLRRDQTFARKQAILEALMALEGEDTTMSVEDIPDERLKLIFTCCHPALSSEARVALTLQTLGGLTTQEIARAFLVPLPTMAQRLVRAKRKIRNAGIPYQVPALDEIPARVDAVLAVLYLVFNAGYAAPVGPALIRHDLCAEAIRLTRILLALLEKERTPTRSLVVEAEVMGLLALLLLTDARAPARTDGDGHLVPLEAQDRARWDRAKIDEGLRLLERALALRQAGPYQIQAAINALHAEAAQAEDTDWPQIVVLYGLLYRMTPSPVVALNRAVAVGMAEGIDRGLDLLDALDADGKLQGYHLYHAVRADFLRRQGHPDDARLAYQTALDLCENAIERAYLQRRLAELG